MDKLVEFAANYFYPLQVALLPRFEIEEEAETRRKQTTRKLVAKQTVDQETSGRKSFSSFLIFADSPHGKRTKISPTTIQYGISRGGDAIRTTLTKRIRTGSSSKWALSLTFSRIVFQMMLFAL